MKTSFYEHSKNIVSAYWDGITPINVGIMLVNIDGNWYVSGRQFSVESIARDYAGILLEDCNGLPETTTPERI